MDQYMNTLESMKEALFDQGFKAKHQDTVKTLFKVLENVVLKPEDPKVRSLPKSNKSVQQKILDVPTAVQFLQITGFNFNGDMITLDEPKNLVAINEGLDCINAHIVSLGGEVKVETQFDPTKQARSTTAEVIKPPGLSKAEEDKYDPTKVGDMIEQVKRQREQALEGKLTDRQIKVINGNNSGANLK